MSILLILAGITGMVLLVCIFSNTGSLLLLPLTTPDEFLAGMPSIRFSMMGREMVLIQPSSTFLVYLLGLVMIGIGIHFLATRGGQRSRVSWGIGLILWGISALAAGTSYQAFGYELKCRGQESCLFTSDFELVYMLLTAYSINFLVAATGWTSTGPVGRRRLMWFALLDSAAYSAYLLIGAIVPVRFLVSYEGFMAFIGVNFVLMFILNIRHFARYRDILNRNLIITWIGFLLANLGYFAFLIEGGSLSRYQQSGTWFNENDALHVLLILWAALVLLLLRKSLADRVEGGAVPARSGGNDPKPDL